MVEAILPGTYITVRDEGLISVGGVASGNIGIVGTASKGEVNKVKILGSFEEAKALFGESDDWQGESPNKLTLIRALELIYNNGGRTVYAVRTAVEADLKGASYLLKDDRGELMVLEAKGTLGRWGNSITVQITDAPGENAPANAPARRRIALSLENVREEYVIEAGKLTEFGDKIANQSKLVKVTKVTKTLGDRLPGITTGTETFSGGADGEAAGKAEYEKSLALLENEIVNVVVLAGQSVKSQGSWAETVLEAHLKKTSGIKRERIGLIGSDTDDLDTIANHSLNNDRLIYTAPGILVPGRNNKTDVLPGGYLAAAVAGLIASLPVQTSPTNKTLTLGGLSTQFNASQLEKLVNQRVLTLEKRSGYRLVKGITTNDGAWRQITTRRIVDYAIYGVRAACDPYVGKLNNERVRGAMKATLDGFLTRMVNDESLVGYSLVVTATRDQEKAGEVMVTMTLQPTFSIDFIKVTMYLG